MKDIRYYIDLVENDGPTDPSRRGFLKKAGAGVAVAGAAAVDPTGTVIKQLVKDLGLNNLSVLDQLLNVATPSEVLSFFKYRLSSGIWGDAITDEEWKLAQEKLPNNYVDDWVDNQFEEGKDGLEELSKLIGRPLTMDKIARVLEKNQINYDDPDDTELNKLNDSLSDLAYGKNDWMKSQDAGKGSEKTPTSSTPSSTSSSNAPVGDTQSSSSIKPDEVVKANSIKKLVRSAVVLAKKLLNAKPGTLPTDLDPEAMINAKAADLANTLRAAVNRGMTSASAPLATLINQLSNIVSYGDKAAEIIAKAEQFVNNIDPDAAISAKADELANTLRAAVNRGMDSASSPLSNLIAQLSNIINYGDKAQEVIAKAERAVDEIDKKVNTPALPAPTKSEYDDLLKPDLNKEKPEFKYWEPAKDAEQVKKSKKL